MATFNIAQPIGTLNYIHRIEADNAKEALGKFDDSGLQDLCANSMVTTAVRVWTKHAERTKSDEEIEQLPDHLLPHVVFREDESIFHGSVMSIGSEEERREQIDQLKAMGFPVVLLRFTRDLAEGLWEVRQEAQ